MSREIKFRVWLRNPGRYIPESECFLLLAIDGLFLAPDGQLYELVDEFHFPKIEMNQVVIEQYTGLKDKNGKEIYEGDIVRVVRSYGYGFLPKGAKAVVEFDEKELCYKLREQGEYRLTANKEVEVVGNIHENKELWNPDSRNPKGGGTE